MKHLLTKVGLSALLLSSALFPVNSAKASFIAVLSPSSSANTFIYDINFLNGTDVGTGLPSERLDPPGPGNSAYVTVYDLFGVTSITLAPAYAGIFSLTTQTMGITPAGVVPTDGPLTNFTVTYIGGATITTDFSSPAVVAVVSSSTTGGSSNYTGQTTKNAGGGTGTASANIGFVTVPTAPSNIPEPASMMLLGGGLLGLVAVGRKKLRA